MTPIPKTKDAAGVEKRFLDSSSDAATQLTRAHKVTRAMEDLDRKFEEEETAKKAKSHSLPYFNLYAFPADQEALAVVPEELARQACAVPFFREGLRVKIGILNPGNPKLNEVLAELETKDYTVDLYLISQRSYESILEFYKYHRPTQRQEEQVKVLPDSPSALRRLKDLEEMGAGAVKISATDLINALLSAAVSLEASDIHLQPEKDFLSVRFRLDGVLQQAARLHSVVFKGLISRIKILSKLKLNVTKVPQDGSFVVNLPARTLEIRVSVLPSSYGESVVLRLLGEQVALNIAQLGMRGLAYQRTQVEIAKPNGLILTTGPTGSGKTTTLYAFLKEENQPGVKIITLENPIEYRLPGVEQTQIDEKAGFSFASALRSVLRQDPDVIMVGEIRDYDTAETAAQAALTGHMVYSTLHTNDAAGAIPRLLHLGVKPVTLSPALSAIIAQRLVRKLCQNCKVEQKLEPAALSRIKSILGAIPLSSGEKVPAELKFYHSPGCSACHYLGYRGRTGVFELFVVDDEMQKLIFAESSTVDIKRQAVKSGMLSMIQDGLLKALEGVTDVAEVFRVTEE